MNPEDQPYMAVAEVAAYLGASRQAAWNRTRRSGFPKPIAILRSGAVWATPDVVKFARRHRPGAKAPATREPGRDVFTVARERLAALGLPVVRRTCPRARTQAPASPAPRRQRGRGGRRQDRGPCETMARPGAILGASVNSRGRVFPRRSH